MRAMILAGGRGRRLLPYTTVMPKPLMPVGDIPIIDLLLRQLHRDGLDDVVVSLGHLGEIIMAYLQSRPPPPGMRISFVHEEERLGTAGALRLCASADETMLVINGDLLTDIRFDDIVAQHDARRPAMTVAVQQRRHTIDFGVVESEDGRITTIREKPTVDMDCCIGVNVYGPEAIEVAARGTCVDFPEVVTELLAGPRDVEVFRFEGFWRDLGRTEDLVQAQVEFDAQRTIFLPAQLDEGR